LVDADAASLRSAFAGMFASVNLSWRAAAPPFWEISIVGSIAEHRRLADESLSGCQPLPPWMLLEQLRSFLQACMPLKWIICIKTVSSCCTTPSGFVPGGGAVGRLCCLCRRCGAGARGRGLDGVSVSLSWVRSAKCKGPCCNFFSSRIFL
jgi:hypothetical protein